MGIHVKWSSGDQIWYDGTQDILRIKDNAEGIEVGEDDLGIDFKMYGATTGNYMLWDASEDQLAILGSADLGDSCEADLYYANGTSGTAHTGAVTAITVVGGIVTAAS